jgi:hypothetical protein
MKKQKKDFTDEDELIHFNSPGAFRFPKIHSPKTTRQNSQRLPKALSPSPLDSSSVHQMLYYLQELKPEKRKRKEKEITWEPWLRMMVVMEVYSRKPVFVKIAFLTLLRSLPLSVLPIPSHTEKDEIWLLASFLAIHSCGGTISPSSLSSSSLS